VPNDPDLLFRDTDHQPHISKIAEHLHHTGDAHHHEDVQPLDVADLIIHDVPEVPDVTLEATKSYYAQQHVLRILILFQHLMLMTPGEIGTTPTTTTTTLDTGTPVDLDLLQVHHLPTQPHIHAQQQPHPLVL